MTSVASAGDEALATLLEAAAKISGADYEGGLEALKSVDSSKLARPDQELLAAVSFAAEHMHDPPSEAALARAVRESPQSEVTPKPDGAEGASIAETIKQAEGLLQRSAALGRSVEAVR